MWQISSRLSNISTPSHVHFRLHDNNKSDWTITCQYNGKTAYWNQCLFRQNYYWKSLRWQYFNLGLFSKRPPSAKVHGRSKVHRRSTSSHCPRSPIRGRMKGWNQIFHFENNNEVHVVSGVLMYMIAYFFMWRYSRKNSMLEPDRVRNTLMVRGLPLYVEKSGRLRFNFCLLILLAIPWIILMASGYETDWY